MKSVSRCRLMWIHKVSIFLLCLQDSLWTFPVLELLSLRKKKKKKPLQRWSPVHRFLSPWNFSSTLLPFWWSTVLLCPERKKPETNKTQQKTQTKRRKFLLFLLKGSLTCPDKIFRHVAISSLFSRFFFEERVHEKNLWLRSWCSSLEKPAKRVSYYFTLTLLQGNRAAVAPNGVVSYPLFSFFFGFRCCSWYWTEGNSSEQWENSNLHWIRGMYTPVNGRDSEEASEVISSPFSKPPP